MNVLLQVTCDEPPWDPSWHHAIQCFGQDDMLNRLRRMFPGNWKDTARLLVVCTGCGKGDGCRAFHVKEATATLLHTVFKTLPDIPITGRWMKCLHAIQWWALGTALHGILPFVFKLAFDPDFAASLSTKCTLPDDIIAMAESGATLQGDLATEGLDIGDKFRATVGARLSKALKFIRQPDTPQTMFITTAVLRIEDWPLQMMLKWNGHLLSDQMLIITGQCDSRHCQTS